MFSNFSFNKQIKADDTRRYLAFGIIALAVLIVYFPSLFYPPRADQTIYLAETVQLHKPMDLILGCYDHNRHRIYGPGDELLFRPLVYVMLGSEQVLFGHQYWAWQFVGIIAHLILVWVLLRLLWRLSSPWLAFAATWVFALSVVNYELVTWPHLSSYLIMISCVVLSIEQVLLSYEQNDISWSTIKRLLVYSFIACFIYETANIFVIWMTGVLIFSFPKYKKRLFVLLVPVFIYAVFSYLNFTIINHTVIQSPVISKEMGVSQYITHTFRLILWWLYEGMFNGLYHYRQVIRTMFDFKEVMVFKPLQGNNFQVLLELVLLPVFLSLAWLSRHQVMNRLKPLLIIIGMMFAYVAVIVIGRNKEMGDLIETLRVNTYFEYIFWVFIVIIAFLFIRINCSPTQWQKRLMIALVLLSLLLGFWEGNEVYRMTSWYSNDSRPVLVLLTTIDLLIQEKKNDPHFSFYVDPQFPGNYSYGKLRKITDPSNKEYSYIELLYPQYFQTLDKAEYKFMAKK